MSACDAVAQRAQPVLERPWRRSSAVDAATRSRSTQLGEPAGQLDVACCRRRRAAARAPSEAVVVAGHRHAEQHPVEPGAPGVLRGAAPARTRARCSASKPQRTPDSRDPVGDRVQVVVGEPEPAAHRLGAGQVEHLAGGDPAAGELDQRAATAEQRVGAGRAPVGQPDPQPVGGVARPSTDVAEAEAGGDQRRVGLDVGAHHQDVARLEGRVVLEQPDQHLAQHVDLAGGAVAGVHLDRPVAARRAGARRSGVGARWRAGRAWSQPSRVSGAGGIGVALVVGRDRASSARCSSRLSRPSEASSGWPTARPRVVVARRPARRRRSARARPRAPAEACGSQRWTSRSSPTARSSSTSVTGSRVWPNSESRSGRSSAGGSAAQPGQRCRRAARRAAARRPAATSRRHSSGCQAQVGVERRRRPRRCPGPRASRSAASAAARRTTRTGRPAAGRRSSGGPAAARPRRRRRRGRGAGPSARAPRLVEAGVDDRRAAARPAGRGPTGRRARVPSSSATSDRGLRNRTPAQTPSPAPGAAPSRWREPLGQPALDALGGHHHDLLGERVRRAGVASSSASPSASTSVRSARWRCRVTRAVCHAPPTALPIAVWSPTAANPGGSM